MDTVPFWVHCATVGELQYEYKDQRYEHGLCVRDTKWTEPVLKLLHEELCGRYTRVSTIDKLLHFSITKSNTLNRK